MTGDQSGNPNRVLTLATRWNIVRIGHATMYWAIVSFLSVFLVVVAITTCVVLVLGDSMAPDILVVVLHGVAFLPGLAYLVGQSMCLAAPPESKARGLAAASTIFLECTLISYTWMFILTFHLAGTGRPSFIQFVNISEPTFILLLTGLGALIFASISHVFLILFLKETAKYFGNYALVLSARRYLGPFGLLVGLYVMATGVKLGMDAIPAPVPTALQPAFGLIMVLNAFGLVLGLVMVVWFLRLLREGRNTISAATNGARPQMGT